MVAVLIMLTIVVMVLIVLRWMMEVIHGMKLVVALLTMRVANGAALRMTIVLTTIILATGIMWQGVGLRENDL